MVVDVHAHYMPREFNELANRFGRAHVPPGVPTTDSQQHIDARLQMMDDAGVQIQILSPPPTAYFEKEADAVTAARLANDEMSELVRRYPARFGAYITLPLPHIDASLREMERGFEQLGMVGVTMLCACMDTSIAEAPFEPIYAELERRAATLLLHPLINGICSPMINDYALAPSVGTALEDSVVVLHMIVRKLPHRFPRIKMIVPHFGGLLPMLLNRLDNQLPRSHPNLPEPPSETAKRFWYDTVGHGSKAALRCACEAFGVARIVPGSDYPFLLFHETYAKTFEHIRDAGLAKDDVDRILHRNAPPLFGLQR